MHHPPAASACNIGSARARAKPFFWTWAGSNLTPRNLHVYEELLIQRQIVGISAVLLNKFNHFWQICQNATPKQWLVLFQQNQFKCSNWDMVSPSHIGRVSKWCQLLRNNCSAGSKFGSIKGWENIKIQIFTRLFLTNPSYSRSHPINQLLSPEITNHQPPIFGPLGKGWRQGAAFSTKFRSLRRCSAAYSKAKPLRCTASKTNSSLASPVPWKVM